VALTMPRVWPMIQAWMKKEGSHGTITMFVLNYLLTVLMVGNIRGAVQS
jgi:hypothetical protein